MLSIYFTYFSVILKLVLFENSAYFRDFSPEVLIFDIFKVNVVYTQIILAAELSMMEEYNVLIRWYSKSFSYQ